MIATEQKKVREHKIIDAHPIIGSLLFMIVMYIPVNLIVSVNLPFSMFIPGYPQTGPIGVILAFLIGNLLYTWWFRPDAESLLKGGNVGAAGPFIPLFVLLWVLSEGAEIFLGDLKLAVPSITSICTAITAGFLEEFFFRGMIIAPMMRKDADQKRVLTALLFSSAVFGLVHGTNVFAGAPVDSSIMQVGSSFALGIAFGAVFLVTGNLWAPAILHTVHDILAFSNVGSTTESGVITHGVTLGSWVDLALCAALAIFAILYLKKENVMDSVLRLWRQKWHKS